MSKLVQQELSEIIAEEGLPPGYLEFAQRWILPLAQWLEQARRKNAGPLLVGVNGAQGTGKTTLCRFLECYLSQHVSTLVLSLDDFYMSRSERLGLATAVHPLLATRGVPGTHDTNLLNDTLEQLLAEANVRIPRFDKGSDDRLPESAWQTAVAAPQIILLEGWCIGAPPQAESELEQPLNQLEREQDVDGGWRRYVNEQLQSEYAKLFARLDKLFMLQAPGMDFVFEWRELQEQKLRQQGGSQVMDTEQVKHFIQHYERVTRHCLAQLPASADYLMCLGQGRDQVSVVVR